MSARRSLLLAALTLLAACGSAQAAPQRSEVTPSTLGGVGVLPKEVTRVTQEAATAKPTTTAATTTVAVTMPATVAEAATSTAEPATSVATAEAALKATTPVGERAAGNRILLIGDSVLAGTSSRYSNDVCKALVPMGWKVEVDAEVGRFIDFGDQVLDRRLSAGWDAAVIFLGSNYGDNQPVFASMLEEQVDRLSPRPVVLVTVTEFKPSRAEVNAAIRMIAFNHPNVSVVDWATISEGDGLLGGDDLHPTSQGRQVLAMHIAAAVGEAPTGPGQCMSSSFRDDSAGSVDTGTTAPARTSTTRRATATTTKTTTKPTTETTSKPTTETTSKPTTATTVDTPQTTEPATTKATTKPTTATTDAPATTAAPADGGGDSRG
ncbi:MAG: hypothetical protein QM733_13760 [Ilumatobacteraceae bacterium]